MEFVKKYKALIIVVALIGLFIASLLLTPKAVSYLIEDATVTEWLADAKGEDYTIITLAQTTCGYCINFHPVANKFASKYDVKYYWIEIDLLGEEDYKELTKQFKDFKGTPYTAILKDGKIKGEFGGEVQFTALKEKAVAAGVTLKERTNK